MMTLNEIDPKDYKYIVQNPGSSYSPARNQAVINETIKDTEKFFGEMQGALSDDFMERIEAVSAYGCYRFNRGDKKIKDYLGSSMYTKLVGEKILSKLRVMDSVNRLNNNNKFKNTILL